MKPSIPSIRFRGFNDAWEQRKCGNLASEFIGGGTPSTTNPMYWGGTTAWIQSSDLKEESVSGCIPKKWISAAGLGSSAARIISAGSLAVVTRVGVGKLVVMDVPYSTSQDFLSFSGLKSDLWFTAYSLKERIRKDANLVQGTSIKGITKEELLNKSIYVPCDKEQRLIGKLFVSLDSAITLHQRARIN
jgi:type I restriction enzyme S subunit